MTNHVEKTISLSGPALHLTLKIMVFIFAVSIGMAVLLAGMRSALSAELKQVSVITDDKITLGDLFDDLKSNADFVLGPAPQPGQEMTLNARTLYRVALAANLRWRPAHSNEHIVVKRTSTTIPEQQIRDTLVQALQDDGIQGRFDVRVPSGLNDLQLPHGTPAQIEISDLRLYRDRDIFEAVVAAPSKEKPVTTFTVSGSVERILSVPVLKNTLRNGDIIGQYDIDWIDLPERNIQRDMIVHEADLIGMTPRRIAFGNKPLKSIDIQRPQLVSRGDNVTIIYESGPIKLTAKGRALQNGAKGDIVRVANSNSNRSLEGVVNAEREVIVQEN